MKNILIILLVSILILQTVYSSQTDIEGFSGKKGSGAEIKPVGLSHPMKNYTNIDTHLSTSWYIKDGQCKQVNETPEKTKEMIKLLDIDSHVYNNLSDCTKSNVNNHHHGNNGNNGNCSKDCPDIMPNVTFLCENQEGGKDHRHPANNPELNPNVHYSNSHLNTNPSIPVKALEQLY